MFKERKNQLDSLVLMSMEEMVPKDHLLLKISRSMDFSFINDKTKHLYSMETGRNCIEPVALDIYLELGEHQDAAFRA